MKRDGHEGEISARTGLIADPYFSGTKIAWILDHVPGARERADRGDLLFGTVDCYLLWRLTGGRVHATDATNASRTLLFNIHSGQWDDTLLDLLRVPRAMLPEVRDSSSHFGETEPGLFGGAIAITGIAGDQQAATIGQACFAPGMIKSTYGTGCFALLNTGATPVVSRNKLLTTIAYQLKGQRTYALEAAIFVAGSAVQWLRDGLGVIKEAGETGALAEKSDSAQEVILVPAFVGLGAPYWNPNVRGALFGLTRNTGPAELARAALESVCYQTCDLLAAMRADWPQSTGTPVVLRVDGGMTASDWTMQRLADLLDAPVDRPVIQETTALGAAYLAGLEAGIYPEPEQFADHWRLQRRFKPVMGPATRERKLKGWARAIKGVLASDEGGRGVICPTGSAPRCLSMPFRKNFPLSHPLETPLLIRPSRPGQRGVSRSSRTLGAGCGGRGSVGRATDIAGRVKPRERRSSARTSDDASGRQSRVVLMPVAGIKPAEAKSVQPG